MPGSCGLDCVISLGVGAKSKVSKVSQRASGRAFMKKPRVRSKPRRAGVEAAEAKPQCHCTATTSSMDTQG
eukprot:4260081-Pleurochrysis_carterae.AAC.1